MTKTDSAPYLQYICTACGCIYKEVEGDTDSGLAPGTRFADIPDDWESSAVRGDQIRLCAAHALGPTLAPGLCPSTGRTAGQGCPRRGGYCGCWPRWLADGTVDSRGG
jgi:rubredoxin